MTVGRKATIVAEGQRARLEVTASCPSGDEVLEAFVYVNQDGRSTQPAGIGLACDGEPHLATVETAALDFELRRGKASASGFILLASGASISPASP